MKSKGLSSIDEALKKEASKQRNYVDSETKAGRKKKENKSIPLMIYLEKEEYDEFEKAMQEEFELNKSYFVRKIIVRYLRERGIR